MSDVMASAPEPTRTPPAWSDPDVGPQSLPDQGASLQEQWGNEATTALLDGGAGIDAGTGLPAGVDPVVSSDPMMSGGPDPLTGGPTGVEGGGGAGGGPGGAGGAGPATGAEGGSGTDAAGGGGAGGGGAGGPEAGAGGAAPEVPVPQDVAGGGGGEGAEPAAEETGAADLSTDDLALIDEELSEHARWGAAADVVGEAASAERAEFVANQVSSGMGDAAVQGAGMALLIGGGTQLATRAAAKFVPVPAVGAIIGGVMAGVGLWDAYEGWDKPGGGAESLGNIGEGASGYEVAANTIQGIITILDLAANILDVIGGISGIVAAACAVAILASLGTLAPVLGPIVATATKIALTISAVTGVMNLVKMALGPLVMLFRALHAFTSEADPREIEAQGAGLAAAGASLGGTVGGLAGGMAAESIGGRLGDPPPPGDHLDGLDPSAPRDTGPEVELDTSTGPRASGADDVDAPGTIHLDDADGAPRLELDTDSGPRPPMEVDDPSVVRLEDPGGPPIELAVEPPPRSSSTEPANPFHDLTDAEIDASVSALGPHDQPSGPSHPLAGATDAEIDASVAALGPHEQPAAGPPAHPLAGATDAEIDAAVNGPIRNESHPMEGATDAEIDAALSPLDRPETIAPEFALAGPVTPDGEPGGLVAMTQSGQNTNPNQIAYHENAYFEGISDVREIPPTLDADGNVVPAQLPSGPTPELPSTPGGEVPVPETRIREQGPSPGPNQPRPLVGETTGGNVEVRYHSENPGAPPGTHSHDNPTVQVDTPAAQFPWADNQTVPEGNRTQVRDPVGHTGTPNTGQYRTGEGEWGRIGDMTPEQRESAHYPVGGYAGDLPDGMPPSSSGGGGGGPLGGAPPGGAAGGGGAPPPPPGPLFEGDIGPDVDRAIDAITVPPEPGRPSGVMSSPENETLRLSYPEEGGAFRYEAGPQPDRNPFADVSDAELDAAVGGPITSTGPMQQGDMAPFDPMAPQNRGGTGFRSPLEPPGPAPYGSEAATPGGPYHGAMGRTGVDADGNPVFHPAEIFEITPPETGYAVRAGPAGSYVDHVYADPAAAGSYAGSRADLGEGQVRSDSAVLQSWNPVDAMNVFEVPPNTPVIRSGIAPQLETSGPAAGHIRPGGGPQTQLPYGTIPRGTSPVESHPITARDSATPTTGPPLFPGDVGPDVDAAFGRIAPTESGGGGGGPSGAGGPGGGSAGPPLELDPSGAPISGPPSGYGDVDLPPASGPPIHLDMPDADPALLSPDTRHLYTGMESGGREFHQGGSMSRMAANAERVGIWGVTDDANTMADVLLGGDEPEGGARGGGPGDEAYGRVLGEEGGEDSGEDLAEAREEARANVEPVNPAYPEPPCSDADLLRMEDDIAAVLADRAQAEADAQEMECSAAEAEANQSTAEAVQARTSSVAGPAAQAHQAAVARRHARNQEQQQKLQQSQQQTTNAAEEVAGTGAMITVLGIWSGFTGLMSYLPGSAGAKFEEMQGEANTFMEKLAEAKGLITSEDASGAPRTAESEANQARIEGVDAENAATQATIGSAEADAGAIADQQAEMAAEAHSVADEHRAEADEQATLASDMRSEHDTLAEQLQGWAEEHKAARAAAVEETVARLEGEGYTVTQVCDW